MKVKTIDINAKQWFDKANGNSYFSAQATINYGTKTAKTFYLPHQYGYGDHYRDMAFDKLVELKIIKDVEERERIWRYCDRKKIILRTNKETGCRKRDMIDFGTNN